MTLLPEPLSASTAPRPPLQFAAVTFRRGTRTILDRVNLTVRAGETVALLGPSGAGKTTLFRLALGFLTADEGEVWVTGREMTTLPERALAEVRSRVGIVFQDGALFTSMTVYENVALGLSEEHADEETAAKHIRETLAAVGMEDFADRMPDELSGGQAQRVAVARAIVGAPEVMLYDEPTQGLDPRRAMEVVGQIRRLSQRGVAGLAVTHQLEYARHYADRVALLQEGRIRYDGPTEGLRTLDDPFVRSFFEVLEPDGPPGQVEASIDTPGGSTPASIDADDDLRPDIAGVRTSYEPGPSDRVPRARSLNTSSSHASPPIRPLDGPR